MKATTKKKSRFFSDFISDPAGTRTQGPNIKSVVLYQLSYEINLSFFGSAKIRFQASPTKKNKRYFRFVFVYL